LQDEARFGQQGTLTAVWALEGSRPTGVRQHGRKSIWVLAAVEPATGWSKMTQAILDAAARRLSRREHAVMILDGAGWHGSPKLRWPRRITPLFLPPYSPELNPVEQSHLRRRAGTRRRGHSESPHTPSEGYPINLPHPLGYA